MSGKQQTQTIQAREVREDQSVTKVVCRYKSRWRRRPVRDNQQITKAGGRWPTVVKATYREHGEGGAPTVYLTLSDDPSMSFCLAPDDEVTVLKASS
ncbi:hypothetical protein [Actinomadura rubrisoli]|uniref:Uncharacterized protein n=1 Tax=Actinomadura rubrisoli TaxID=2530368 RepID=A0A4R5CJU2_9ACTN|nr:hypothetical protein [Actinomadura rubrisoli]TDD97692.1 hypothetical protein E1298_01255 [Actinomadura rubrisoli]